MDYEKGMDWNHISFQAGLKKVCSCTGITFVPLAAEDDEKGVIGRLFWKAFLRGGYQGGIWLIETLRNLAAEKDDVQSFIEQWNDQWDSE